MSMGARLRFTTSCEIADGQPYCGPFSGCLGLLLWVFSWCTVGRRKITLSEQADATLLHHGQLRCHQRVHRSRGRRRCVVGRGTRRRRVVRTDCLGRPRRVGRQRGGAAARACLVLVAQAHILSLMPARARRRCWRSGSSVCRSTSLQAESTVAVDTLHRGRELKRGNGRESDALASTERTQKKNSTQSHRHPPPPAPPARPGGGGGGGAGPPGARGAGGGFAFFFFFSLCRR